MQKNKAFFLDRDGVIIQDIPYLNSVKAVKFLPGVETAIEFINRSGYKCIVITNQSGIARGLLSLDRLFSIHDHIRKSLEKKGATIDAFYFCPHHPQGRIEAYSMVCGCRKPGVDLIYQAAREYNLVLSDSIMVGDQNVDIEAGEKVGCRSFLLYKPTILGDKKIIFRSLGDVVQYVLS